MTVAPTAFADALADRYELRGVIGEGGMATVYQAYDQKHDRIVALKVLHDDLAAELGPERFKREIRIAARLQHPHILSVFDSGEAAGRFWFTMPFVNGESLRDRIDRESRLPVEDALRIAREAAQALAHAHKQGVIHRDVKPENILLTEDGSTLVADFGIARSLHDNVGATGLSPGLTQTGSAIGTPMYMAPEQAAGETGITAAVDQYALAAVLYEMLTGKTPFTGATAAALMAARFTTGVAPITQQRADVPDYVDTAVRRALELNPSDRFETIAGFTQAVAPSVNTPTQFAGMSLSGSTVTPPKPSARMWKVALAAMAVVAAASGGLFLARQSSGTTDAGGPVRIAVLPFENLGDTTDAYFADGVADELRGKLLALPGVQVIARVSSMQYAGTTKSPNEIAKELDVGYLLTGTIRWERMVDGKSVVHLRPELVFVSGDAPPTTKWQQAFDQPLTDVLAMQTSVAQQVAEQLQLQLGAGDQSLLAAVPTTNAAAYDAFLRGVAEIDDPRPMVLRRVIASLERAVTLDPNFADAWYRLAAARSSLSVNASMNATFASSVRDAAERASRAAPNSAAAHKAWGIYYNGVSHEFEKAEQELRKAIAVVPNDANALRLLGLTFVNRGDYRGGLAAVEQSTRVDPRNARAWSNLGIAYTALRRRTDAQLAFSRAVALAPGSLSNIQHLAAVHAAAGRLDSAQAVIRAGYAHVDPVELDVYMALYWEYGWLLDDAAQRRVLDAPLPVFDGAITDQAIVRSQLYRIRGDSVRSRAEGLRAMEGFAALRSGGDTDPQVRYLEAFAAALAGKSDDARRLLTSADDNLAARSVPATDRDYFRELRARIHVMTGAFDAAFDDIDGILAGSSIFDRGHLKLDPTWAPLRTLPRYQRIMAGNGK